MSDKLSSQEKIDDKFVKCNILGKESFTNEISKIKEVKSSNGISQKRFLIVFQMLNYGILQTMLL